MRVLGFVAFLVVYLVWMMLASVLMNWAKNHILANKTFWPGQLITLVGLVGMFAFVYLLAGYFDWRLMAALFAAAQIGVVLSAVLGGLLGSATSKWGARSSWASGEFGLKHVWLTLSMLGLSMLIMLAYPVAVGIAYFGLPAAEVPARIFQYTLSMFFVSGTGLLMVFLVAVLVSENVDEDTRLRYFLSQLGALVPNALWLALLFSSFGSAEAGQTFSLGRLSLNISPLLLAILTSFFVLTVLLPYLVGSQRAKKWRTTLLERRKKWMEKLKDILETPSGSVYLPKLAALQKSLVDEATQFAASDPMIPLGIQIDVGVVPKEAEALAPAYRLTRDQDPRFQHLELMQEMSVKIGEIEADLATEQDLEKAAKEWTKYLRAREGALNKDIAQARKTRTPALLILSGLLVPIFSVILGEFAKWLWDYFSKTVLS